MSVTWGGEPAAEGGERGDDLFDIERISARVLDQPVLCERPFAHERGEPFGIEHVSGAQSHAASLVGVGGADPLQRRADLVVAANRLGDRVVGLVPGEDQVCVARHLETRARDATALERVELVEEGRHVDDDTVRDHRGDVVVQNARRDQLQRVPLAVDDDRVPRVVPALVAHDVGVFLRQQVDDLGFALVTPLGSDDDGDRHARSWS